MYFFVLFILFYFIRIRCLWWDGCFRLWLCYIGMNVLVHSIKVVGQLEVFIWFAGLFDQREKEKHGTVFWKKLNKFNQKEQNSTYDLAVFCFVRKGMLSKVTCLTFGWMMIFPIADTSGPKPGPRRWRLCGERWLPRHCIHCLAVLHPNQHHRLARRKFIVLFCLQFCFLVWPQFAISLRTFGRGSPRRCPPSTLPKRRSTWDTLGATTWSCADEQRTARRCRVQLVHRVNASYHLLTFKFWHLRSKLLYKLVTIKSL